MVQIQLSNGVNVDADAPLEVVMEILQPTGDMLTIIPNHFVSIGDVQINPHQVVLVKEV